MDSDHGEMVRGDVSVALHRITSELIVQISQLSLYFAFQLGAHGMRNKYNMLEESVRVPLILSGGGLGLPKNVTVEEPVSHIDLFSTVLDFMKARQFDNSDGKTLRRFIEKRSWNKFYDERVVVVEIDERSPLTSTKYDFDLATSTPNFLVRKGSWKLMLPKLRNSSTIDVLYDLQTDPYEMSNLLGSNAKLANETIIGRAEMLKCLLLENLKRNDGPKKYYSDPKYNLNEGEGDYLEILRRRTWPEVDYWQSDDVLSFGPSVKIGKKWFRNEVNGGDSVVFRSV